MDEAEFPASASASGGADHDEHAAETATSDAVSADAVSVEAAETASDGAADASSAEATTQPAEPTEPTGPTEPPEATLNLDALAELADRPDDAARDAALSRLADVAVAAAGLGRLEELAVWLAGAQGVCPTRPIARARVVVFAGDHGIAAAGVSAFAPEATAAQVKLIEEGGAAVNVLARLHGASVRVVDVALGQPSGRIDLADAATREETEAAFRLGMSVADAEVDSGADLLIPALVGVGHTTAAAALAGVLTGKDAAAVTGRGSGIDDQAWMRKCGAVRDAMRRGRPVLADQLQLLATVGGRDLAAVCGFLMQAVLRKTPVLLDGVGTTSCAMLVQRIAYRAPQWWLAGALSTEPAHKSAVDRLSLHPLLPDYALRQGEGVMALAALPMLQAAAALLAELPTFEEAGLPAPVLRSRI
jgi:nicotinate-nucleotide--dimethylbenzimidazole phosphoribosyltransferase